MNKDFWNIPWLSPHEKVRIHILYLSCIRFVVGKHGGSMQTDKKMQIASIKIPKSITAVCYDELQQLDLIR
jgi:hypothetical protein